MKLTNLTGAIEIGANCYLLEAAGKRLLLDAGSHPKREGTEGLPRLELIKDGTLDAILMSHAHQDHIGSLPVAMRRHPDAPVLMTQATRDVGEVMLHNSVNVMLAEKNERDVPGYPLFTHRELDSGMRRWKSIPLHTKFNIAGERVSPQEDCPFTMEFFDAGHILGSVGTVIRAEGKTIFYTGDVQFDDQNICRAASFPDFADEPCDVMIMESTRGERPMTPGFTRDGESERLAAAITRVFDRGGCVMVPLFALGKTQEFLAMVHMLRRKNLLPNCPIYIGGLGAKLTELYDKLAHSTARQNPDLDLMDDVAPFVIGGPNAYEVQVKPRRIFALSSGMMMPKTLSNTFARKFLRCPEHAIFFVGYADPDSPAGKLRSAKTGDMISLAEEHAAEPIQCEIDVFNFSAHATREGIVDYIKRVKPKKLVLVHGDPAAIGWLTGTIRSELPQTEIILPIPGVAFEV
jgi:Cft2 family RNA processing exonuclease